MKWLSLKVINGKNIRFTKKFGDNMGDTPGLVILKLTKKAIEYDDRKSF